ncbi:MAG: sigma-54-dependent Fis family transcriptional regulator [Gammaproteobacteria bacterium]|nr:MAG: sigma-54-dependent Fis family transcriptional regulator [Gammaproteobacteria bacterium]
MRSRALIVDDEPDIRELLELTLSRMDIDVISAANVEEAKRAISAGGFHLCITDMRLPDGTGLDLLGHIQQACPDLPVAVLTAHGNMDLAIQSLKAGAFDFVSKPVDLNVLRHLVSTALKLSNAAAQTDRRSRKTLLGESPAMQKLRATIHKLARSQAPVYISGESGTGKELVARLIHEKGPRGKEPFVPVNCGAIPSELMESEFFGHLKGSFTGASKEKEGLFQAADGGTLFLDEVAELPLHMQVKLLRAIQEKAIRPVGAQRETSVDVRILSATHKNLEQLVNEGVFRQDLYYRINVINLQVPSLRDRKDDLDMLAEHILEKLSAPAGEIPPFVSSEAMDVLRSYSFPGNVRELENILERAMTMCENNLIEAEDLQLPVDTMMDISKDSEVVDTGAKVTAEFSQTDDSLEDYLESIEKEAILKALEETNNNKTAAAKKLGMTFRSLRYRLSKLGIS